MEASAVGPEDAQPSEADDSWAGLRDAIAPNGLELAIAIERLRLRLVTRLDGDLQEFGATFAQLRALLALQRAGGLVHAGELGRQMRISRQAAHTLLRRLDRLSLIDVVDEGWAKGATLTPHGLRYARFCLDATAETLAQLSRLPPDDRRTLARLLEDADRALWRAPTSLPEW